MSVKDSWPITYGSPGIASLLVALSVLGMSRALPDAEANYQHIGGGGGGGYIRGGYGVTGGGAIGGGHDGGGHGGAAIVQKHIYVHVPPPDPEAQGPRQPVVPPPPPKKHYKIVFIKAPSYPQVQAPVIPAPQSDIEKTLIYVLHRNPTDAAPIVIPTAKPTQPAKPEVYFIRYKTKKELGGAIGGGGHHYDEAGEYPVSTTLAPRLLVAPSSTVSRPQRLATPSPSPSPSQGPSVSILPRANLKNVHRR